MLGNDDCLSVAPPPCTLTEFGAVTEDDILDHIKKSPAKSSVLDPIPTWFIKQNAELFVPVITRIANTSLTTGVFPKSLKHAVITPIIKKQSLNPEVLKNYRPVSNIPYISKVIEKHALKTINSYIANNDLGDALQSAYRPAHSTETALLKVKSDIMQCLSNRKGVFLVLLDLSAAFDTVNHDILLNRLKSDLGIGGAVLQWFQSYLTGRSTCVGIDGVFSDVKPLKYGVPQGSMVGPVCFNIYTSQIGSIIKKYPQLLYHIYADDIQLYTHFNPADPVSINTALSQLSSCIFDIKTWMTRNMLQLNDSKTEFFVALSHHLWNNMSPVLLRVGDDFISPADNVRNLGVIFDNRMTMATHIKTLCRNLNFQLRNIGRIRRFLDHDTCHLVVRALVLSRVDYGNALLLGANTTDIQRLQRIQNWAAKLICRVTKSDHATPCLRKLHWLPIRERIDFKILTYVYKCLYGTAPSYLSSLFSLYRPTRSGLRSSSDTTRLAVHRSIKTLKTADNRSLTYVVPRMWNHLPRTIRESVSHYLQKMPTNLLIP